MSLKDKYINEIKQNVIQALQKLGVSESIEAIQCEIPPNPELGNLAFPMFKYSAVLKDKPFNIAEKIKKDLIHGNIVEKVETKGKHQGNTRTGNFIRIAARKSS